MTDFSIFFPGEQGECVIAVSEGEKSPEDDLKVGSSCAEEDTAAELEEHDEVSWWFVNFPFEFLGISFSFLFVLLFRLFFS